MSFLTSITGLRALEAVVRTGSITAAAADLSVTHSAVSHQVRKLEKDLATKLLVRRGRGVIPTDAGVRLATELANGFRIIADAVRAIAPADARQVVTVSCTGTFLLQWLIPRLYRFKAKWPDIQLKLVEDFQGLDFAEGTYDIAIRIAAPPWPPGVSVIELEAEVVGPVLSQDLMAQHMAGRDRAPVAADLSRMPLVHTRTRPNAWPDWAMATETDLPDDAAVTWFDHYYFLLEGVRAGLGVGIVPEILARDDVARGQLVAPLGFIDSGSAYVVAKMADDERHGVRAFQNWLLDEFSDNRPTV